MANNRRNFIKKTGVLAAASAFSPNILLSATKAKKEKLGVAAVLLSKVFFWGWEMSEFGGGKCQDFGGGKCPPGK